MSPPRYNLALTLAALRTKLRFGIDRPVPLVPDFHVDVVLHPTIGVPPSAVLDGAKHCARADLLAFADDRLPVPSVRCHIAHRVEATIFPSDVDGAILAPIRIRIAISRPDALHGAIDRADDFGSWLGSQIEALMLATPAIPPRSKMSAAGAVLPEYRVGHR